MEQEETFKNDIPALQGKSVRMAILSQLTEVAASVSHIDELLRWFAHAVVHRFGAQAVQVWANQAYTTGKTMLELRTNVCPDLSNAAPLLTNQQVADVAQRILREQYPLVFQAVDGGAFSTHQSLLLKRHGMNYFAGSFLGSELWLPPAQMVSIYSAQKLPTVLRMTVLLFLRSVPTTNALPMLRQIMEQALPIAQNSGLLLATPPYEASPFSISELPTPIVAPPVPSAPSGAVRGLTIGLLIPHRVEDVAHNPLADSLLVSDKQVRRFYAAIDDSRTMEEICALTQLDMTEAKRILRMLLERQRVRLYTSDGDLVRNLQLINNF